MRANTEARMREIAAQEGFRIRGLVLEALGAAGLQIQERECYKDFRPIRVSWKALNRVLTADDVREIVREEIAKSGTAQAGVWLDSGRHTVDPSDFAAAVRDGIYWIVDGQHRFHALVAWAKAEFGDEWGEWTIQVWCHENLTEPEEARLFLAFNSRRQVNAYDKFKVGVTAGLPIPTDIDRIVRLLDLRVEKGRKPNSVSAVGALEKIYSDGDAVLLRKALETVRDAWAGSGFDSEPMQGVAKFINRYEGRYESDRLVRVLGKLHNGARGLRQLAAVSKETYGGDLVTNHAAAVTEIYNKGLRGKSNLGSWWKQDKPVGDADE